MYICTCCTTCAKRNYTNTISTQKTSSWIQLTHILTHLISALSSCSCPILFCSCAISWQSFHVSTINPPTGLRIFVVKTFTYPSVWNPRFFHRCCWKTTAKTWKNSAFLLSSLPPPLFWYSPTEFHTCQSPLNQDSTNKIHKCFTFNSPKKPWHSKILDPSKWTHEFNNYKVGPNQL